MRRLLLVVLVSTCTPWGVVESVGLRVVGPEMSTLLGPEGAGVSLGSSGHLSARGGAPP